MSNVPTILWYLVFLLAMIWLGVLIQYYQIDVKLRLYWKRIETAINRIPVRKFSGGEAAAQINRLQFPNEKMDITERALLSNLFVTEPEIERIEIATWRDLGEMSDGTENSDKETVSIH